MNPHHIFGSVDPNQLDPNDPNNYGSDDNLVNDYNHDGMDSGVYGHAITDFPNYPGQYENNHINLRQASVDPGYDSPGFEYPFTNEPNPYFYTQAHAQPIYHQNQPYHENYQNYAHVHGVHPISNYDQRFIDAETDFRQDFNTSNFRPNIQASIRPSFIRADTRHISYFQDPNNQYQNIQFPQPPQSHPPPQSPNIFASPPSFAAQPQPRSPLPVPNFTSHVSTPRPDRIIESLKKHTLSSPGLEDIQQYYDNDRRNDPSSSFMTALSDSNLRPVPALSQSDDQNTPTEPDRRPPLDTKLLELISAMRQAVVNLGVCPVQEIDVEMFRNMPSNEMLYSKIMEEQLTPKETENFSLSGLQKVIEEHNKLPGISDITSQNENQAKNKPKDSISTIHNLNLKSSETDHPVPSAYLIYKSIKDKMAKFDCKLFTDDLLLYIYYTVENDMMKMSAIAHLFSRNWRFSLTNKTWYKLPHTYYPGDTYKYFDQSKWEFISCDKVLNMSQFETESYSKYLNHKTSVVISQSDIKTQLKKERIL